MEKSARWTGCSLAGAALLVLTISFFVVPEQAGTIAAWLFGGGLTALAICFAVVQLRKRAMANAATSDEIAKLRSRMDSFERQRQ